MNKMGQDVPKYYKILEGLRNELNKKDSYQCFSTHLVNLNGEADSYRNIKIMFVGRTTNGWEEKEIDVAGEDLCYLTEKQMPFLKDKSYTNMSQFWNVIKKVVKEQNLSFAYSNLYRFSAKEKKLAKCRPKFLKNAEENGKNYFNTCADLLYEEIVDLGIERCIFLTGTGKKNRDMEESIKSTWIEPFKKRWEAKESNYSNKLYKHFSISKKDGTKVTKVECLEVCHPQGKKLDPIVKQIKNFIEEKHLGGNSQGLTVTRVSSSENGSYL